MPGEWTYSPRFHRWDHESGFGVVRTRKLDESGDEERTTYTRTDTGEEMFTDYDVSRYAARKKK